MKSRKIKLKFSPFLFILGVILAVYALSVIMSVYWAIISSLKSQWDFETIASGGEGNFLFGLPTLGEDYGWRFDHYIDVFLITISDGSYTFNVAAMFLNSVIYSVGCALFNVLANMLVAYAISTFKFKFSNFLYRLILICMVLPIVGTEASALDVTNRLGVYNNMFGMFLLKGGFIGMYTLIVYEAFAAVPRSFIEAAEIDGASNLRIFLSIAIPMVKNVLATVFLLYFIQYWNDYQTPLLFMPSKFTLAYGIYLCANFPVIKPSTEIADVTGSPFKLTIAMVLTLPILTAFVFFNKRIMGNVSLGGIKE